MLTTMHWACINARDVRASFSVESIWLCTQCCLERQVEIPSADGSLQFCPAPIAQLHITCHNRIHTQKPLCSLMESGQPGAVSKIYKKASQVISWSHFSSFVAGGTIVAFINP